MTEADPLLAHPGRRAAAYWFVDGLPELAYGLLYLALGGGPALLWPCNRQAAISTSLALTALFLVFYTWDRRILGLLKARITYPRTGYVRPPADAAGPAADPIARLTGQPIHWPDENVSWFRNRTVFLFFTGFQLMMVGRMAGTTTAWLPMAIMAAMAAALWRLNRNLEHRYSLRSVLPLGVSGVPFVWIHLAPQVQLMLPFILGGAWLTVRGAWTLQHYLKENPLPARLKETVDE
jgi:hypothetical protein